VLIGHASVLYYSNEESGFVYLVEWWDKKFKRTLECASKHYSETTAKATIELAKKIDR